MATFRQYIIKVIKDLEIENKDPVKIARVQELSNITRTSEEDKELDTIMLSYKGFPPRELQDPRLADKYWFAKAQALRLEELWNHKVLNIEHLAELKELLRSKGLTI